MATAKRPLINTIDCETAIRETREMTEEEYAQFLIITGQTDANTEA